MKMTTIKMSVRPTFVRFSTLDLLIMIDDLGAESGKFRVAWFGFVAGVRSHREDLSGKTISDGGGPEIYRPAGHLLCPLSYTHTMSQATRRRDEGGGMKDEGKKGLRCASPRVSKGDTSNIVETELVAVPIRPISRNFRPECRAPANARVLATWRHSRRSASGRPTGVAEPTPLGEGRSPDRAGQRPVWLAMAVCFIRF